MTAVTAVGAATLAGLSAAFSAGIGWWVHRRAQVAVDTRIAWFRVASVPPTFFAGISPCEPAMQAAIATGAGTSESSSAPLTASCDSANALRAQDSGDMRQPDESQPVGATQPALGAHYALVNARDFALSLQLSVEDSEPAPLLVHRFATVTPIGAIDELALGIPHTRVPWMRSACAAAGLLCAPTRPLPRAHGTEVVAWGSDSPPLSVPPLGPWMLGMDLSALPVSISPLPGTTIAVFGPAPHPPHHPWVRVIHVEEDGEPTPAIGEKWRQAWGPDVCRVVLFPGALPDPESALSDIHADVVVSIAQRAGDAMGEITHVRSGFVQFFWPVQSSTAIS